MTRDMTLMRADSTTGIDYIYTPPRAQKTPAMARAFNRVGSFIDNCVALVSPAAGIKRQIQRRGYEAFNQNRLTGNRLTQIKDSDSELNGKLPRIRAFAREEVRNNGFARNAKRTRRDNVIGDADVGQGVTIDPAVQQLGSEAHDDTLNALLKSLWTANRDHLELTGKWGFTDLGALADKELFEAGEVLAIIHDKAAPGSAIPFSIEMLEADRLPMNNEAFQPRNPYGEMAIQVPKGVDKNGETVFETVYHHVRHGIEYGPAKQIVAYHILKYHPGNQYNLGAVLATERVLADRVIHYFDPDRAEQTRGVSDMVAGLPLIADLRDLFSWELVGAKVQACFGVHFGGGGVPNQAYPSGPLVNGVPRDANGNITTQLQPGMVTEGPSQASFYQGNRPGGSFEPFTKFLLRAFGAAIGMGYSTVAKDYSNGSYSSLRQEALEDRRGYRTAQGLHVRHFYHRIWRRFVRACAIAGLIDRKAFYEDPERFYRCHVNVPGWSYVNPLQEAQAEVLQLANGMKSHDEVPNESGTEPEDRFRIIARLKKLADKLGITLPCFYGVATKTGDGAKQTPAANEQNAPDPEASEKQEVEQNVEA